MVVDSHPAVAVGRRLSGSTELDALQTARTHHPTDPDGRAGIVPGISAAAAPPINRGARC
jgi:hypothetical protein